MEKVNLAEQFASIKGTWVAKIVGEMNGHEVKLVKLEGPFPWYKNEESDELYLVIRGSLRIEFIESVVFLQEREFLIVPRGAQHRSVAISEVDVMIFEPTNERKINDYGDGFAAPAGEIV